MTRGAYHDEHESSQLTRIRNQLPLRGALRRLRVIGIWYQSCPKSRHSVPRSVTTGARFCDILAGESACTLTLIEQRNGKERTQVAILNRIRQLRVQNDNMSQAKLAREIEVSRQTLNAIERGQRVPSLEVAYRIADALECDLDDVFRYESEFPAKDNDDGVRRMSFIVCLDHDPEWWKSDDVSRVTTRA